MKVNQNVYGDSEKWAALTDDAKKAGIYCAYFSDVTTNAQNLYEGEKQGKFSGQNPFDLSFSLFGVNPQSSMVNIDFIIPFERTLNDKIIPDVYQISANTKESKYPLLPFCSSPTSYMQVYPSMYWSESKEKAGIFTNTPCVKINYQKIILCCYLTVFGTDDLDEELNVNNTYIVEVDDYFNENYEFNYKNKQWIINGFVKTFYGTPGDNIRRSVANTASGFCFTPLLKIKDISYTNSKNYKTPFSKTDYAPIPWSTLYVDRIYTELVFGSAPITISDVLLPVNPENLNTEFSYITQRQNFSYIYKKISDNTTENIIYSIFKKSGSGSPTFYKAISNEFLTKNDILKQFSYIGFYFTGSSKSAFDSLLGENITDSNIHAPLFDSDYVTTGNWISGKDITKTEISRWDDVHENINYNPNTEMLNNVTNSNVFF